MTLAIGGTLAEHRHTIETRQARVGIVGMGYVGLPETPLKESTHPKSPAAIVLFWRPEDRRLALAVSLQQPAGYRIALDGSIFD
ncbi:MAG: hypothetical protein ACRD3N_10485 [Terracidiphilus sp.]